MLSVTLVATISSCLCQTPQTSLEDIASLFRNDVRVIMMGDSFSTAFWSRVGMSGLRVWPIPEITAICGGAGLGNPIVKTIANCSPYEDVLSANPLGYSVERHAKTPSFFTLPTRGLKEIYTDKSFATDDSSGTLFTVQLNVDELDGSVHGPFTDASDNVKFRLLYRCPNNVNLQPSALQLHDFKEHVFTWNPKTDARKKWHLGFTPDGDGIPPTPLQINAAATDIQSINQLGGKCSVHLVEDFPLSGKNNYFQLAGGVYYKTDEHGNPKEGFYYSSLADDSWNYSGHGNDEEGIDTHHKTYSLEQLTHWLDVTTLRREQPVVFMWLMDVEELQYSAAKTQLQNMVSQANAASIAVGIEEAYHLILTPHMHAFADSSDLARAFVSIHEQAGKTVAKQFPNVVHYSLYQETDGVLFNGTTSVVNWLTKRGFTIFEYGDTTVDLVDLYFGNLLDAAGVHPRNNDASAFFAAHVGNGFRKALCPTDIKPDGYINVHDLLILIDGWGNKGESDVNNDGTTNVSDLLLLVDNWGECWPVQAPFNE